MSWGRAGGAGTAHGSADLCMPRRNAGAAEDLHLVIKSPIWCARTTSRGTNKPRSGGLSSKVGQFVDPAQDVVIVEPLS